MDAHVERIARSLTRWRVAFLLLAVVLPAGCHALFERQARRLDALGDHGVAGTGTVTKVNRQGTVFYEYEVGGVTHTWNVAHEEAPYAPGATFPLTYLPEDPTLSRPGERSRATAEAASNRAFAWKLEAAVFLFFAAFGILCHVRLWRLRKTGRSELNDPAAYRARLVQSGVLLVPFLVLITWFHASDAARHGEPVSPVIFALVVCLGIIGGVGYYTLRDGPAAATERSVRGLRWVAPLAAGIAALRVILYVFGRP